MRRWVLLSAALLIPAAMLAWWADRQAPLPWGGFDPVDADKAVTALRLVLVVAALLVFGSTGPRRRLALGWLAGLAFAANFNFFLWPYPGGFHAHDVFHYYIGAKYFPELGYYDIYRCSAAAMTELHPELSPSSFEVRDLRQNVHRLALDVLPTSPRCDGAFDEPRWQSFRSDVDAFLVDMGPRGASRALRDYGYNPSPVWTLIGRPVASLVPADALPLFLLARLDLVLMGLCFGAIGWAFGFETLCLAVLVWGGNPLCRYQWVGDAFLRYLWLAASIGGICCLKARRPLAAGALLALGSLLRLFPALFAVAYGAWAARAGLRLRRMPDGLLRCALGAGVCGLVLLAAAPLGAGRGAGVYGEFGDNMRTYSQEAYWNSVGLRPLLALTTRAPEPEMRNGHPVVTEDSRKALRARTSRERWPVHAALALLALALLWRAAGRCEDWEAATLGVPLILVFVSPPGYYMSCAVALALPAGRHTRLRTALLGALAIGCVTTLALYQTTAEYQVHTAVFTALAGFTLFELGRPRADDQLAS